VRENTFGDIIPSHAQHGARLRMIVGLFRFIRDFLRSNFIAGMFIAVPFAITVIFLVWVWQKVDEPLAQIFNVAAKSKELPWAGVGTAIDQGKYTEVLVPVISLMLVLVAVLVLGIMTRSIIGRMALRGLEGVVGRVPVIGMLYMSMKQLAEAFISTDGKSKFKKAVLVQFPYKDCWAIGFVTGHATNVLQPNPDAIRKDLLTVFVPTTPLPTAGFMVVVPESETRELNVSVQDALKMVVSGGMLNPGESHRHKKDGEVTRVMRRETNAAIGLKSDTTPAEPLS
jgi:uncharacterized membrane protein